MFTLDRLICCFHWEPQFRTFPVSSFYFPKHNIGFPVSSFYCPKYNIGFPVSSFYFPKYNIGFPVSSFYFPKYIIGVFKFFFCNFRRELVRWIYSDRLYIIMGRCGRSLRWITWHNMQTFQLSKRPGWWGSMKYANLIPFSWWP